MSKTCKPRTRRKAIRTDVQVRKVKPPTKDKGQIEVRVANYPGLFLRVSYGGARTWAHFYRHQGNTKRQTLGRYPVVGLAAACQLYLDARLKLLNGEDPGASATAKTGKTFEEVMKDWLQRDQGKKRTRAETERVLSKDALPVLGQLRIGDITREQLAGLIDGIVDRGAPSLARKCHAHLHNLFGWAVKKYRQHIAVNPMAGLPVEGTDTKRERALTEQEIRDVWRALDVANVPASYPALVRMLLLTAARREEVAGMAWREVEDDVWVIPAARHKTGEKTGDKLLPLTPAVLALLGKAKGGHVFSATDKPFQAFSRSKGLLDQKITELREADGRGPMPQWQLHDLRRTARTIMSKAGVPWDHAERVVGHAIPGIRGVYDKYEYLPEKRDALERLAKLVDEIVRGAAPTPAHVMREKVEA